MFTSNIKRLMTENKKTFRALEGCGVSRQTIHKARTDAGISECRLSTLGRIASALEVPVKGLFDGEYEPGENMARKTTIMLNPSQRKSTQDKTRQHGGA